MKIYSLVGKKLTECLPDELYDSPVGMIVDEKEEMIRLILTPMARKKQREILMQQSAEFNKKEYAGTYLVSFLENPSVVNSFLKEIKEDKATTEEVKEPEKPKKKKKKKKKGEPEPQVETETHILERWDKDLVKKTVEFLDGKQHASLAEIQKHLDVTEGETYWVTQDLIYVGTLPGRWIGYDDGSWYYQVITDQPLSKAKTKPAPKKKTTTKKTTSAKKTTTKSKTSTKPKTTATKSKTTSTKSTTKKATEKPKTDKKESTNKTTKPKEKKK